MTNREDDITVRVRSFVLPYELKGNFELGVPFTVKIPPKMNVGELALKILTKNIDQLGIIAVNGEVVYESTVLKQGDRVGLFALIDGG